MSNKSVFEQLSSLNLGSKTEKRGNLTYLSWAHAWGECKKLFPDMTRKVYESDTCMNYFSDGATDGYGLKDHTPFYVRAVRAF